jgi:nitrous oxidase accessory protein NosD
MVPRWLLAAAAAALGVAAPAGATTYVVSTSGSDTNNGTTAPFRTFQKAASALGDGDTLLFQAGTYTGGAWIERANITLRGENGAVIDGRGATREDCVSFYQTRNITLENLTFRNATRYGAFVVLSSGLTIRNCSFLSNGKSGVLTGNTSDVLIENCLAANSVLEHGFYCSQSGDHLRFRNNEAYGNGKAGIQINAIGGEIRPGDPNFDSLSTDCELSGNVLHDNGRFGAAAINLMGVQRSLLANNLIYRNLAGGITLYDDGAGPSRACKNNQIVHNTLLFAPGVGRFGVQFVAGSTGNQLLNNIIVCGMGPAIETAEPIRSNFNCLSAPTLTNKGSLAKWRSGTGNDLNSSEGTPVLLPDFRLPPGSPCQDTGTAVSGVGTDLAGTLRPQGANPDLGCFETVVEGTPDPDPDPEPAPTGVIYGDALASGWSATASGATLDLGSTDRAVEGQCSAKLSGSGRSVALELQGSMSLKGKEALRLSLYTGAAAKKAGKNSATPKLSFAWKNGRYVALSSLAAYVSGGADDWVQYTIPVSELGGKQLTGLRLSFGKAASPVYVDDLCVE